MHKGTFPKHSTESTDPTYSPGSWSTAELEDDATRVSRRQWMFGVCGIALCSVAAGAALSQGWISGGGGSLPATDPSGPITSATPEWALDLLHQPAEALIKHSGDLERVSGLFRTDTRLVPIFERLLDVVLDSRGEYIDMAGAIAVRSLNRMGRIDSIAVRERRIRDRADLEETRQTTQWVLNEHAARDSDSK